MSNHENFRKNVALVKKTIKELENNLLETRNSERKVLLTVLMDNLKNRGLSNQLEEARNENLQLLDILQNRCSENDLGRSESCSTMSMVHLQYKYEELIANHNGLLKTLQTKITEIQRITKENTDLKNTLESQKLKLMENDDDISSLNLKIDSLHKRRDYKIEKLNNEFKSLKTAYGKLKTTLHEQSLSKDKQILDKIRTADTPEKALLLQEVRKNNMITYQNIQLKQEVEQLQNIVKNYEKSNVGQGHEGV